MRALRAPADLLPVAVFLGVYAYSFANLAHAGKLKLVPVLLAVLGLVALALWLFGVLPWLVPGLIGLAFFFSAPSNRAVAGKLAWGGYALYGATSYVGVVLSYIRIMALGMVTGGIAMAINTVAWMVTGIPVLGVVKSLLDNGMSVQRVRRAWDYLRRTADMAADYLEGVERYPVLPRVEPGAVRAALPADPPEEPEPVQEFQPLGTGRPPSRFVHTVKSSHAATASA